MPENQYSSSEIKKLPSRYGSIVKIGQGGTGTVVKAFDQLLGLEVAIKIMPSDCSGKSAARLQKEASSTAKLSHPNIAKIFDFAQLDDGTPYMVMEFLKGQTLSDLIRQDGKLGSKEALPVFIQIAEALRFAHEKKIIHRDVKPSNVMLLENDSEAILVKLLDFGTAQITETDHRLTAQGAVLGSPLYMSPEQADAADVDERSDIYSFGCLMYETLAGKPPLSGASPLETLSLHKKQMPVPVISFLSQTKLNEELSNLIEHCLQKDKSLRPSNSKVIVEKLNNLLLNEAELAVVEKSLGNKTSGNKPPLKALIAAVLVLSISLLAFLTINIFFSTQVNRFQKSSLTKPEDLASNEVTPFNKEKMFELISGQNGLEVTAYPNVLDSDFAELGGKKIFKLHIRQSDMNGSGFRSLKDSSINELILHDPRLNNDGMKCLREMQTLKHLEIVSSEISSEGLEQIKFLKNLESLNLSCSNFSEKNFVSLENLKHLKNLEICNVSISDKALDSLKSMKQIVRLALKDCSIESCTAKGKGDVKLRTLELDESNGINSCFFSRFDSTALEELHMEKMTIEKEVFSSISSFKKLNYLSLSDSSFSPEDLVLLSNLPNLEILKLDAFKGTSDQLISDLTKFHLKILSLEYTDLTDRQFLSLSKLKTLNQIKITGCRKLSPEAISDFKNLFQTMCKHKCEVTNQTLP